MKQKCDQTKIKEVQRKALFKAHSAQCQDQTNVESLSGTSNTAENGTGTRSGSTRIISNPVITSHDPPAGM